MTAPRAMTIEFEEPAPVEDKYPELAAMLVKLRAERAEILKEIEPLEAQRDALSESIAARQAEIQRLNQAIRERRTGRLVEIDALTAALVRVRKQTQRVRG